MGKLAKPQRSKKHKKIKAIDPFYAGKRKDSRGNELNQRPKDYNQEVPRKLRHLGLTVNGVREGKVGKKSKNKFHKHPDGPGTHQEKVPVPSSSKTLSSNGSCTPKNNKDNMKKMKQGKKDKKGIKSKISDQVFNEYVDNLQPARPFTEPFNFKKKQDETDKQFNLRVNQCANRALTKSKIDDHFELSDEKKMLKKMIKLKKGMSDKKKHRLKEKKLKKAEAVKEKKLDKLRGFDALQDKVEFGETVHAPPALSVRPKKAVISGDVDRPGRRMPELHDMIAANKEEAAQEDLYPRRQLGTSVKRRNLTTHQQKQADSKREMAIEAYRQLKKKIKTLT